MVRDLSPDVMTLDIALLCTAGLDLLEKGMPQRPLPVVAIPSPTETGARAMLRAIKLGAVDFVSNPKPDVSRQLMDHANLLIDKIRAAANARVPARSTRNDC